MNTFDDTTTFSQETQLYTLYLVLSKEIPYYIYSEKENIWTFDVKGELLITIMSSLAQKKSRSISENTTWGQRKRFADGKASVAYKRFLGYDRGPNDGFVVNK